jgi:iron complex outermembrane receptor protein
MTIHRKTCSLFYKAVLAGVVSALCTPVIAQDASQGSDEPIEEIITTGSRIARNEFTSSSPITVVDGDQVAMSGVASIDEYLKDVPAFTGYQMGSSTNNGSEQGQKKLDLRGLGFNRTLVLVNGRRMIGDNNSTNGAVDLNNIPEAMIKRVEVLKDGASTIYGSDAIAGIINIILHDDFEGLEFNLRYGEGMDDGQAANSLISVLGGVSSDVGNMVMSLSWSNQDEMVQAEQPWATETLYPQLDASGNWVAVNSGSSNSRKIRGPGGDFIWDSDLGYARPFDGATDTYNYAPVNALVQPIERFQLAANGSVFVSDTVEGYFDMLYTRRTAQQRLAPDASFATSDEIETPNNGLQWNDFVPASNPFNPFGVNGCGPDGECNTADDLNQLGIENQDVRINRRFEESGGRLFAATGDTYRMVAGVRGSAFDDAVDWDFSFVYSENETVEETINYGRFDRWATAVDPAACAADSACPGVLNPFYEFGSITPEQMAYLSTGSLKDLYAATMAIYAMNFSGSFGDLAGGAIGWAAGVEHRKETGEFKSDEFLAAGLTTGGATDPLEGQFSVDEVYGELLLPFMENFDLSASVRWSDYDTAGSKTTYKIGGDWAVTDEFRLRATYATGFRAPNIAEVNTTGAATFPVVDGFCEFADRRLAAGDMTQTAYNNCRALIGTEAGEDGDDAYLGDEGEYGFQWQSLLTLSSPTEQLKPEESKSYNFGFIYEPSFLEGLSIGVDYWNIEIEEVINNAQDMNQLFEPCMNSVDFSDPACDAFDYGPFNLDEFFIYPGDATLEIANTGTLNTDGVDLDIAYVGETGFGGYELTWSTTWTNSYEVFDTQIGTTTERVGTAYNFAIYPEWRMNLGAGFFGDNWTVDYYARYIGSTDDYLRPCYLTDDCKAESILYSDIVGTYTWQNMTFNLGIRNLTDEEPPNFHTTFNANTEPGTYDVVGRQIYAGVRVTY